VARKGLCGFRHDLKSGCVLGIIAKNSMKITKTLTLGLSPSLKVVETKLEKYLEALSYFQKRWVIILDFETANAVCPACFLLLCETFWMAFPGLGYPKGLLPSAWYHIEKVFSNTNPYLHRPRKLHLRSSPLPVSILLFINFLTPRNMEQLKDQWVAAEEQDGVRLR